MAPSNAASPMLVTPDGIVMEVNEVVPLKASDPKLVTLDGIVMEVNEVASQNVPCSIFVSWLP